ncbi:MAG: ribosome biogenesis GTP-binding protein YihA/YsxC [Melioribacteraceae bacterium]|nr:ribosome biogenesis GTP-binding protein YihA/YsxC [Melioribacteraceae bacterium]
MKEINFVKSVADVNELPKMKLPEIVLAGRSNVGKSSFINHIFGRKKLAKISSTPGKTRTINYFNVDDKFFVVDLPGFGYAKVSKTEREQWRKLIENYFASDRDIITVYQLIDSRHDPSELDILLYEFLNEIDIPVTVILNKVDKLKQAQLGAVKNLLHSIFPNLIYGDNFLFHSTVKGTGKKRL